MKYREPYTGAVLDVFDEEVARDYIAGGFEPVEDKPQEKPKPKPRKRAAKKDE